jgi:photosystem II stability/assembly factor-like uncharacterized protein
MKKILTIAFFCFLLAAQAQVTFTEFQMPENIGAENYRLVVDYYSDQQVFFPVMQAGKVYAKNNANGSFNEIAEGLYITAFYANNGDLYLVKNAKATGFEPHLYKSTDNGKTQSEITGVAGRLFRRDQFGNLYYSVSGGFAYTVDDGKTFKTVSTPKEVFSAVRSPEGKLFYITEKSELFRSANNGSTWEDISKSNSLDSFLERHLWWKSDTLYFQSGSNFGYTTESNPKWVDLLLPFTSIITNVSLSPDNVFYCTSPYGFFSSQAPVTRNWTILNNNQARAQETIYNNYIAVADSTMYYNCYLSGNNTSNYQIFYAPRIPNVVSAVETVSEQQFGIFPNPASNEIRISNKNGKGEFRIYDIQGKIMLTETLTEPNQNIDIRSLKPGVYIWKMKSRKGMLVVQ